MKNKIIIICLAILSLFSNFALAVDMNNLNNNREIKNVLKEYSKAINRHKIHLATSFYDKEYKSYDGFDIEDMKGMLQNTQSNFENMKYKTKINNIYSYNDWALVQMSDKTRAKVYPSKKLKYRKKAGVLDGRSSYIVYLKKEDDSWKIFKDEVLMEETSLKYGIAKKIKMNLFTPVSIDKNKDYNISLQMDMPEDIIALASLSREEITYPAQEYKEKYRKYPNDGVLERIVHSNDENKDEYALASVGFTKVSINEEETKARIQVLGMAYLMRRINMNREANER